MPLRHPANVSHVSFLSPAPWKRYIVYAILMVLYAMCGNFAYQTMGEPYQWALDEQKRMVREKAAENKEKGIATASGVGEKKDTDLEIDYEALPSEYVPNAWCCAVIFLTITLHVLFHLMCHWSMGFRTSALFQPAGGIYAGAYVRLTPHANKGQPAICLVEESEVSEKFHFTFQYQLYQYVEPGEKVSDLIGDEDDPGVRLIECPINLTWSEYNNSRGLKSDSDVEKAVDKYGTNIFELPRPTFLQIYKTQLSSPLVIFQFFCTFLWMMDTYWKYTCFTLMSIMGYEASMAFQRLKSMAQLRGMGTKPFNVLVFRQGEWSEKSIEELLPGDLFSLTSKKPEEKAAEQSGRSGPQAPVDSTQVVPCDCLILTGSAIVNEATLTGESVPQMKDALGNMAEKAVVDAFGKHRVHALFSGTSLIQATPPEAKALENGSAGTGIAVPPPPNDGIVCYVLRTGFNSSQGELMRMIEFSTENVGTDKIEMAFQLLFLLCFALVASGYVLKKGLEDPTKPTYKTLLRCTLILTSVVPPSLPMQMAFAVHTALMALVKGGIFCTEPFRVPYAGRVSHCFFDKTGTLTSDQMVAAGVVNPDSSDKNRHKGSESKDLGQMKDASMGAAMVIGGCHSLIEVNGKLLGDPIEVAALNGVQWSYIPGKSTASPGLWRSRELFIAKQKEIIAALKDDVEADKKEKKDIQAKLDEVEKTLKEEKSEARRFQVVIEQRYHFSSELQRMSTVCKVQSSISSMPSGAYCLTKGSPEAIEKMSKSVPEWYQATYKRMAEEGQRVLALAYRKLDTDPHAAATYKQKPREDAERELTFAGFISFKCETRKDSGLVIKALNDSAHRCIMLTGDAPLTALSVANQVNISAQNGEKALVLTASDHGVLEWLPAITSAVDAAPPVKFQADGIEKLSASHELVVTGKGLQMALQRDDHETVRKQLSSIRIFARLSPQQKEDIIQSIAGTGKNKSYTLMCGDGGNDVGALKEADVGIALLSGFGNANASTDDKDEAGSPGDKDAEEALSEMRKENAEKAKEMQKKAGEEMSRKRRDLMSKQQQWVEEELAARRARGEDAGVMAQFGAMKSVMSRLKDEMKKEQDMMQKKHGNSFAAGAAKWAEGLDEMEETPMVKLGDASTAAPFTTRTPSISACVDIVRQGRCTLLSAVQQMQIMMLESMISAYTMSAMSVDGTRPSEAQMMASGSLMTVASLAFSFAKPVDRMHKVRPLSSVFHPAIMISMIGQLLIHLSCMIYIASLAKELMGPEKLQDIVDFEKDRNKKIEGMDESAFDEWNWFMSVPFKPNLLNTCCWLVETSQQIAVIFVNYKGRPWMQGLLENQPLFLSLFLCIALVAMCAWGAIPYLNELLNLEVVPEDLRPIVMGMLMVSLVGSFLWDRLCVYFFAPHIWSTMVEGVTNLKPVDFFPLLKTVGYVAGGAGCLLMGNPIMWGLMYMVYRNYKSGQATKEEAAIGNKK